MAPNKRRVAYFYKPDIGSYYYGPGHPMKPHRLRLTHHLLLTYGLYRQMEVLRPHDATSEEMERFHSPEYVSFLRRMSPDLGREFEKQMNKFNIGPYSDCPVFDGLYDFMSTCAGGSIDAAAKINHELADICINWSGGLHHAKKGEASGFCYINDIVLGILELLKYHTRVLYVDIDIHHGDGVEEAFYTTDRVMTVSFHKYGDFFPGSGAFSDIGVKDGKYYAVNFPLKDGLDDFSFENIYKPVMSKVMEVFKPGAIVMCCGADSITGDRLGCWNLSLKGHGMAVEYMKTFGVPLMLLGGGGYTPRNVARCWTYETAIALGEQSELDESIPYNTYHNYFGPHYKLHLAPDSHLRNMNTKPYLEKYTTYILENLGRLGGAPSIEFQDVPPDFISQDRQRTSMDKLDDESPDTRRMDIEASKPAHRAEYYTDEMDVDKTEEGHQIRNRSGSIPKISEGSRIPRMKKESEFTTQSSNIEPSTDLNDIKEIPVSQKEAFATKENKYVSRLDDEDIEDGVLSVSRKEDEEESKIMNTDTGPSDQNLLPTKRPYLSGTECGGFLTTEETEMEEDRPS